MFTFSCYTRNIILSIFGPKNRNCLFKVEFTTQTNSNVLNLIWMFNSVQQLQNCLFKLKFGIYNPGHNISKRCNVLVQVRFATSQMNLDIQYNKLGIRFVLRVAEELKTYDPRKLGNQKTLETSHIWVETWPSKKHIRTDIKVFQFCSILLDFLTLLQIFCPGLNKIF